MYVLISRMSMWKCSFLWGKVTGQRIQWKTTENMSCDPVGFIMAILSPLKLILSHQVFNNSHISTLLISSHSLSNISHMLHLSCVFYFDWGMHSKGIKIYVISQDKITCKTHTHTHTHKFSPPLWQAEVSDANSIRRLTNTHIHTHTYTHTHILVPSPAVPGRAEWCQEQQEAEKRSSLTFIKRPHTLTNWRKKIHSHTHTDKHAHIGTLSVLLSYNVLLRGGTDECRQTQFVPHTPCDPGVSLPWIQYTGGRSYT